MIFIASIVFGFVIFFIILAFLTGDATYIDDGKPIYDLQSV